MPWLTSNQLLYGAVTLLVLIALGVGLVMLVNSVDWSTVDSSVEIKQPVAAPPRSSEWLVYDTENSELPQNHVIALASDIQGDLWIGTLWGGLAKFDGEAWTVYNKDNSGLPSDQVSALAFDDQGSLWVGTGAGLAKFDGETWTVYTTDNSDLPYDPIHELVFDTQGNLWVGTERRGLLKFDGQSWMVYNEDNSGLPDNNVWVITIDMHGNKWIGTDGGLAVYREGGVILPGEGNNSKSVSSANE